ncbi:MAG: NADPH:quinone reductase [Candidatus Puniceispirillales bacterium]
MKAALYRRKGPARDVIEIETLKADDPAASEIRVRLMTSGVNPSDVKLRAGVSVGGMTMPFPAVIPHSDGAGVVDAVGKGVSRFREGDRVWVYNGGWQRAFGTAAEYIVLPEAQVNPLPEKVSFAHGACLGIPGLTAVHAVTRGGDLNGRTVLISSGGGVVGRYCIEVARALGAAQIITTASSDQSRETAQNAGADVILDYRDPDLGDAIMEASGGIDHAVEAEFGVNAAMLARVINPCGSIASYGSALDKTPTLPFYDMMFKNIRLDLLLVYLLNEKDRAAATTVLLDLLEAGAITENIAATLPLADCATAHEKVEASNKSGSVILDCS